MLGLTAVLRYVGFNYFLLLDVENEQGMVNA
jgi:hypothetical protein